MLSLGRSAAHQCALYAIRANPDCATREFCNIANPASWPLAPALEGFRRLTALIAALRGPSRCGVRVCTGPVPQPCIDCALRSGALRREPLPRPPRGNARGASLRTRNTASEREHAGLQALRQPPGRHRHVEARRRAAQGLEVPRLPQAVLEEADTSHAQAQKVLEEAPEVVGRSEAALPSTPVMKQFTSAVLDTSAHAWLRRPPPITRVGLVISTPEPHLHPYKGVTPTPGGSCLAPYCAPSSALVCCGPPV